jgi:uncharacterized protein YegL
MTSNIDPELRRLPVYLLLDCSSSMSGPPIEAVKEGVKMLLRDLSREPWSQGMVWISIITFSNTAEQVIPLTEITRISEINLAASGMTALSHALKVLAQCIDRDIRKRTSEHRGDFKPIIYLLTDGQPTDEGWEQAAHELRQRKIASFVACAAGSNADESTLRKITDTVIRLQDATPDSLRAFIKWVSDSVLLKSRSAGLNEANVEEPALFRGAEFVGTEGGESLSPNNVSTTL